MECKECVVRGTLSFILRVSSFVGIAPLHFEPHQNGYRVTLSDDNMIFKHIVIAFINISAYISFIAHILKGSSQTKPLELIFIELSYIVVASVFSIIGAWHGSKRMKNMIRNLSFLEKIRVDAKLASDSETSTDRKNRFRLTVCFMLYNLFVFLYTYYTVIVYNQNKLVLSGFIISIGSHYLKVILQAQFVFFILEVYLTLSLLNKRIILCASEDNFHVMLPLFKNMHNGSQLANGYVTICNVVKEMNQTEGIIALMTFAYFLLGGLSVSYFEVVYHKKSSIYYTCYQIYWHIICLLQVASMTESCHGIQTEVAEIRKNLSKLLYQVSGVGERIPLELELMFKQIVLNKPVFTPVGMFTLQRSVILSIYGVVITYLLFIIDNGSEVL